MIIIIIIQFSVLVLRYFLSVVRIILIKFPIREYL